MKYDPRAFSDGIIAKINEADGDLDTIGRILDKTGEAQDYRWAISVVIIKSTQGLHVCGIRPLQIDSLPPPASFLAKS